MPHPVLSFVKRHRLALVLIIAAAAVALVVLLTATTWGAKSQKPAGSRTYYVSPSGSDKSPGTRDRPFRTLSKALGKARAGYTVVLREGTYAEFATISRSGTRRARITLRAQEGERAVLTGRLKITGSYVSVVGLVFRGGTPANDRDVLLYISGGDNVRIARNEITGAALSGIFLGEDAEGVRIVANWIHDNGTDPLLDHGIYFERGSRGTISTNVIEGNAAYGVHLYPDADGVIVSQNTIVKNGRSGVIIGGESDTADDNLIVNNVIAFNGEYGIRTYWGGSEGARNEARNNLLYENELGEIDVTGVTLVDNMIADPLFVDVAAGDYHLAAASPALDRALAQFALPFDLDGRARPRGSQPDLGAFER